MSALLCVAACARAQAPAAVCSGAAQPNAAKLSAMQPELDRIAALHRKGDLGKYLALAQHGDDAALFSFTTSPDADDPAQRVPSFSPGGLGMQNIENYTGSGPEQLQARFQYVTKIVQILRQVGETQPQAEGDASTILQLETALARVSGGTTATPNYLRMPRGDLAKLAPALDWDAFLSGAGFAAARYVNVAHPDFLLGLNTILNHEDLPQIRTYLRWQVIRAAFDCR